MFLLSFDLLENSQYLAMRFGETSGAKITHFSFYHEFKNSKPISHVNGD